MNTRSPEEIALAAAIRSPLIISDRDLDLFSSGDRAIAAILHRAPLNGGDLEDRLPSLRKLGADPNRLADLWELGTEDFIHAEDGERALAELRQRKKFNRLHALGAALSKATDPSKLDPDQAEALLLEIKELDAEESDKAGPQWLTAAELSDDTVSGPDWLLSPFLARESVTDGTGKVKCGKTWWALYQVYSVITGAPFLGQKPTTTGPVIYLTEERRQTFREALRRVGILRNPDLHLLFRHSARGMSWPSIVAAVGVKAREIGAVLLVVDTVSDWAGLAADEENDAGAALAAVRPLHAVAAEGLAVLMLRHDRKSGGEIGDSGRGSSAWAGAADILWNLRRANTEGHPNRRHLVGVGRFEDIPAELLIELKDGEYINLGDAADVERREVREQLDDILPGPEGEPLTESEILERLGEKGSRSTCKRVLDDLISEEAVIREKGYGKTGRAWGYRLTGKSTVHIGDTPEQSITSCSETHVSKEDVSNDMFSPRTPEQSITDPNQVSSPHTLEDTRLKKGYPMTCTVDDKRGCHRAPLSTPPDTALTANQESLDAAEAYGRIRPDRTPAPQSEASIWLKRIRRRLERGTDQPESATSEKVNE